MIRILTTRQVGNMIEATAAIATKGERSRLDAVIQQLTAERDHARHWAARYRRDAEQARHTIANLPTELARPRRRIVALRASLAAAHAEIARLQPLAAHRPPLALPSGDLPAVRTLAADTDTVELGIRWTASTAAWGPTGQPPTTRTA